MADDVVMCLLLHLPRDLVRLIAEYTRLSDVEKVVEWLKSGRQMKGGRVKRIRVPAYYQQPRPLDLYWREESGKVCIRFYNRRYVFRPNVMVDFAAGRCERLITAWSWLNVYKNDEFRRQIAAVLE